LRKYRAFLSTPVVSTMWENTSQRDDGI